MNKIHSEWRRLRNNLEMQAKMSSMLTIQFGINLTRICLFKKKWRIFRSILVSIIEVHRRITRMSLRQPQIPVSRGIISECLMQKYPESLGTCLGLILGIYRFVDVERRCLSLGVNHNTHVVWKDNAKAWANTVYRYDVTISITAPHFELKTFVNKNVEGKRTYPSPNKPKGNGWS